MKSKIRLAISLILTFFLLSIFSNSIIVYGNPTYEDYTTYTEVDPNNHITKTTNHIDHDSYKNEDAYVYKDKGTDHFGDFTHTVQCKVASTTTTYTYSEPWVLSNDLDDVYGLWTNGKTALMVEFGRYDGTVPCFALRELYNSQEYYNLGANKVFGTTYYLTIQKIGTSLTCKIYSDSARTTLLETLSLTLHGDWKFRYIFGCNTFNTGSTNHIDADIDNLDLQEIEKQWEVIESWSFNLLTKQWIPIESYSFQFLTRGWTVIQEWSFNLITRQWVNIEFWSWSLFTRQWSNIEQWTFNLLTRQWFNIESWSFNLLTLQWKFIEGWNFTLLTKVWQNIEEWFFELPPLKAWKIIESWTFTLLIKEWRDIQGWLFTLKPLKEWTLIQLIMIYQLWSFPQAMTHEELATIIMLVGITLFLAILMFQKKGVKFPF